MKTVSQTEMPFTQHLAELRTRILKILLGVVIGASLTYNWAELLFQFLTGPIRSTFSSLELIGTDPTEAFVCKLRVALTAGAILSSPFTFLQLWLFVAPGLHESERRFALPFILVTTLFFLGGVSFCFFLVLPVAFDFFSGEFTDLGLHPNIRIGEYLEFVVKLILVFGVVFELPVVTYFLARMGLVSHRWLIDRFRYAIVIIFIVAGVLTPPDVLSQMLLASPLLVIYGLCILITYYVKPQPKGRPGGSEENSQSSMPASPQS